MKYYTASGRPASPTDGRPVRPRHYDPHARRFDASNHLAVAFDGRDYICKGVRTFDLWDEDIYNRWVEHLTAEQVRELDRVLARAGGDIDKLLKIDWTKDPDNLTAKFAARVNALMAKDIDRASLASAFFNTFKPMLMNAPEMFGKRHRFLSVTRFDEHDARALDFLTRLGQDNAKNAIGKYIDERNSKTIVDLVSGGMKDGLGPDEIASKVAAYVKDDIPPNKTSYARLVSQNMMTRTRSHSAMASMNKAGFRQCLWNSILDESTTTYCILDSMPISTIDGPKRAIDVPIGMRILTKTQQWRRVKDKSVRQAGLWRIMRFHELNELIVTPQHRIYSDEIWRPASCLNSEDFVATLIHDLHTDIVRKGEAQIKEARTRRFPGLAVNFEVEGDDPTFIAQSVVVHNCRFMHGKVLSIPDAMSAMDDIYAGGYTPKALKNNNPFMSMDGNKLKVKNTTVATMTRSGVGRWDDTGEFKDGGQNLMGMGVVTPPCHHGCRSSLIPVFSTRSLAPTLGPAKVPTKPPIVKAAPPPAWMERSPWAADASLQRILLAEASAWDAWCMEHAIPAHRVGATHVREYAGDASARSRGPAALEALESWAAGPGPAMDDRLRDPSAIGPFLDEVMTSCPRLLLALHPDLFFFALAEQRGVL